MVERLELCKNILQDMKISLRNEAFNVNQCNHLISKFVATIFAFEKIVVPENDIWNLILQDLYRIMVKGKSLVEDCSRDDWWYGTIMQLNNKEAFRELLLELGCCFHTMCDLTHELDKKVEINMITFYPITVDKVLKDTILNNDRLLAITINTSLRREIRELATYLVEKMRFLEDAEGRELESIVFPESSHITVTDPNRPLGSGGFGSVYHAKWFGLVDCAIKVLNNNDYVTNEGVKKSFDKEACILGGLSHPNVVKLMCCGMWKSNEEQRHFLGMEKMEMDLSKFLEETHSKGTSVTHLLAIDLMLQIANGMSYLHDMKVAHHDLKPNNVLLTPWKSLEWLGEGYARVKLVDFGISKTEVPHKIPLMPTGGNIGTLKYMALEVFYFPKEGEPLMLMYAFKADVYNFGILL